MRHEVALTVRGVTLVLQIELPRGSHSAWRRFPARARRLRSRQLLEVEHRSIEPAASLDVDDLLSRYHGFVAFDDEMEDRAPDRSLDIGTGANGSGDEILLNRRKPSLVSIWKIACRSLSDACSVPVTAESAKSAPRRRPISDTSTGVTSPTR